MKQITLSVLLAFFCCGASALQAQSASLLKWVNPFIGTDAHGHTHPAATTPFGMVQLGPDTRPDPSNWDGCSGYHYTDTLIYGFSHTHLSGTGVADYCDILVMPYVGKSAISPELYASPFYKRTEKTEPGYYAVALERFNIQCEMTATPRVGVHRYQFPRNRESARFLIDLRHRDQVIASTLTAVSNTELVGSRISKGWAEEQHVYFVIRFSKPYFNSKLLDMSQDPRMSARSVSSDAVLGLIDFQNDGSPIVITVGISGVSVQQARKNLDAECPGFDFDGVKRQTQAEWQRALSRIEVEGGTDAQKTIFYTSLYHAMLAPNIWSDNDKRYRGRNKETNESPGHDVYTVFSLWDTYRALHPLLAFLEPDRTSDFIRTFLRQHEQGGLLPVWELSANETNCMIGNHAIPVIHNAYLHGLIDKKDEIPLLQAMTKAAEYNRLGLEQYQTKGYVPSDEEPESVSKTLEYAWDDWCIADYAQRTGQIAVAAKYRKRAQYYRNLFDPKSRFFRGRANGGWHTPFDPTEVNFNYTEANAWQYRFAAAHDMNGVMDLLGGPAATEAALDSMFTIGSGMTGRRQADITGLIGQYAHGNEPCHHVAYLYDFVGRPHKTQQRVRQIMNELYTERTDGLCGNDDCGQMSAWYVFSAMGFYPVGDQYAIGSPLFDQVKIKLDTGKEFVVKAPGASKNKPYIQSARLSGKPLLQPAFGFDEIPAGGGVLELTMGEKPSNWGEKPENRARQTPFALEDAIVPLPYVAEGRRIFRDQQTIRLDCADKKATIHYTLDGGVPDANSPRYTEPLVVTQNTHLIMVALRDNRTSAYEVADFTLNTSQMRAHRYNSTWSPQYTARGQDGLCDLLYGGPDFRSGGWQGFEGQNLDVVFDLGDTTVVSRIRAHFMQDENSWIFFPSSVQYDISLDGVDFIPAGTVSNEVSPLQKGILQKDFELNLSTPIPARYVRVSGVSLKTCPAGHKGEGAPCWIFVDEINVN